jgi:hypothetical protein
MKNCFTKSVIAGARVRFSAPSVKCALEALYGWSEKDGKRRRGASGVVFSTSYRSEVERQLKEITALCDDHTLPGKEDNPDEAENLLRRCLCIDYKFRSANDGDHDDSGAFIGIAPDVWNGVCAVIYDCAAEARCAQPSKYLSILRTGQQESHLRLVLRTWGRAEWWRWEWVPSPEQKHSDVEASVGCRLECTPTQAAKGAEWYAGLPEDLDAEVLDVGAGFALCKKDLCRLATESQTVDAWLNDHVIDSVVYLLQVREDLRTRKTEWKLGRRCDRTVFLPRSLYNRIRLTCEENAGKLPEAVFLTTPELSHPRCGDRTGPGGFDFECARMVMVCGDSTCGHWEVIEIDFRNNYIRHYCSLGRLNERMMQRVLRWLTLIAKHRSCAVARSVSAMKLEHVRYSPRQKNGFDCGVFAVAVIDFLALGLPIERITQEHMPSLRKKYLWELWAKKVQLPPGIMPDEGDSMAGARKKTVVDATASAEEDAPEVASRKAQTHTKTVVDVTASAEEDAPEVASRKARKHKKTVVEVTARAVVNVPEAASRKAQTHKKTVVDVTASDEEDAPEVASRKARKHKKTVVDVTASDEEDAPVVAGRKARAHKKTVLEVTASDEEYEW